MAEEAFQPERSRIKKGRMGHKKGNNAKKKAKMLPGFGEKVKIDRKMKKLFRKRAREYNSDDDDNDEVSNHANEVSDSNRNEAPESGSYEGDDSQSIHDENGSSGDDMDDDIQPGITKFTEGCSSFRLAFKKIIKQNVSADSLGPVLAGHKKLVVEKLAEEESEQKLKGNVKKERQLVKEKGHVKPENFLDSHEKFLLSVATKGVVKLFNAVNKAQSVQKRLNPSRSKDLKVIQKRRKEAFFTELGKAPSQSTGTAAELGNTRMLTNSKFKDRDKMQNAVVEDDKGRSMPAVSSSDDDWDS